jgi:hypothetical protein
MKAQIAVQTLDDVIDWSSWGGMESSRSQTLIEVTVSLLSLPSSDQFAEVLSRPSVLLVRLSANEVGDPLGLLSP